MRDDGTVYPSTRAAAEGAGVSDTYLSNALRGVGFAVKGHMYAYEGREVPPYRERDVPERISAGRPYGHFVEREDGKLYPSMRRCRLSEGLSEGAFRAAMESRGEYSEGGHTYRRVK